MSFSQHRPTSDTHAGERVLAVRGVIEIADDSILMIPT